MAIKISSQNIHKKSKGKPTVMQMKGLVKFFTFALILVALYQLSFTWFVRSHESDVLAKAKKSINNAYPSASVKYPGDKEKQALYEDTLNSLIHARFLRLADSTSNQKITWWGDDYKTSKDRELKLGLDLQGGINVTMEVGYEGLVHSLASNTKDLVFNQALGQAVFEKGTSGADFINLFVKAYHAKAPSNKLAPLFVAASNKKIDFNSSDDQVVAYLHSQAKEAFLNTARILKTRIDAFGVSSPNINPDENKGVINIELAGATDKDRVRKYLQSSANLQFYEVYNIDEIGNDLLKANDVLKNILAGVKTDSVGAIAKLDTAGGKTDTASTAPKTAKASADSLKDKFPLTRFLVYDGYIRDQKNQMVPDPKTGKPSYHSELGGVMSRDTATLGEYLRMPEVLAQFPANIKFAFGSSIYEKDKDGGNTGIVGLFALKANDDAGGAKLQGDHITDAGTDFDERGRIAVSMKMDNEGGRIWAKMTKDNIGRPIAIVLDDYVYSAPNIINEITGGSSQISGNYAQQDANDLANILKSDKFQAPAKIVQEQVVGASLGEAAIHGGKMSFIISFIMIFVLMLVYYNTSGWVANASLILNIFFTISALAGLGATLTSASIAGLVLTIGMAVDTNVIIFERIKEELGRGKNYQAAVNAGYRRSMAPVLDSHVTTFLTAAILFYFGLGPVRGFATTQMIGIVLNLFCGILVSRLITEFFTNKQKHLTYFTSISTKIFKHASFKFIEFRKVAYIISIFVLIAGIAAIFNGFDKGVEFKGGHSFTVNFGKPMTNDVEAVKQALKPGFNEEPVVKTIGDNNQLEITTSFLVNKTGTGVELEVEKALYQGLQKFLPANTGFEAFDLQYKVGSNVVKPSISEDLVNGAKKATIISILIICLYIFIRFRDWRYALGTIISLLHDVLVTLAVFSFARKIVPFPLEIDQHFIAAILTVIGFSMNDTIIVFDRVRENSHLMPTASKGVVINKSINDTLSRTIMTSLTVFLTLLVLFIFGGDTTRGFAFAMMIGVITGTYSSIFVAAPILVDFGKDTALGGKPHPTAVTTIQKNKTIV